MKELYKLHEGRTIFDHKATICGYDHNSLIAAIHEDEFGGWHILSDSDVIVTCLDNEQGYVYCLESDIDKL